MVKEINRYNNFDSRYLMDLLTGNQLEIELILKNGLILPVNPPVTVNNPTKNYISIKMGDGEKLILKLNQIVGIKTRE